MINTKFNTSMLLIFIFGILAMDSVFKFINNTSTESIDRLYSESFKLAGAGYLLGCVQAVNTKEESVNCHDKATKYLTDLKETFEK